MTESTSIRTLIDAKLTMPTLPRDLVLRPAVVEKLEASRVQAVTLASAPAGYGKTTAVVAWLQSVASQPPAADAAPTTLVAWYALDESDDQFFTFVTYLVAAIERVLPGGCSRVTASLRAADLPAPDHLAALLLALGGGV